MTTTLRGAAALLLLLTVAAAPAPAADTYDLDAGHTMVLFKVDHLGFSHSYGRFNDVSGSFVIDEENPAAGSVTIEIKTESVDSNHERRDKHLRSPDFFSATQFPTITFKSTGVSVSGDDYTIKGDLTMRGVTKPVTIELTRMGSGKDPWGNDRVGFNGGLTIKRSEFGVNYMPDALGEEVEILLAVEGVKQK